ncbi:MAG: hypothetical protein ABSC41_15830 [Acidimicrobiales bacterium]
MSSSWRSTLSSNSRPRRGWSSASGKDSTRPRAWLPSLARTIPDALASPLSNVRALNEYGNEIDTFTLRR